MEQKKITIKNEIWDCEINITKEEWKRLLQDITVTKPSYKDILMKIYNEPEHKSTCKNISVKYGLYPNTINVAITSLAKAVHKKLNRFDILDLNGNITFWPIVMKGRYVGRLFEWTIRPELLEAVEELRWNDNAIN